MNTVPTAEKSVAVAKNMSKKEERKKILVGKFAYVVRMHYFCRRKHEIGAVVQFG